VIPVSDQESFITAQHMAQQYARFEPADSLLCFRQCRCNGQPEPLIKYQ
jgi:hypothetical protein